MKNFNLVLLISLCCLLALFTSCEEACLNDCQNGGSCVEGSCDCPEGFSGDTCQTEDLCITQAPDCLNGGTCLNGACDCPDGTSGTLCETEWRSAIMGTYPVQESCDQGSIFSYSITLSPNSSDITKFTINNIYSESDDVEATMTDANNFTITQTDYGNYIIRDATGAIDGNNVTISAVIEGTAFTTNCSFSFTIQ